MPAPINTFKAALAAGTPQIGLWLALANPITRRSLRQCGL